MLIRTGSSCDTWHIDTPCDEHAELYQHNPGPCRISEMDNYGDPTGYLWCAAHAHVCGWVAPFFDAPPERRG
jgi:hypothetical protein